MEDAIKKVQLHDSHVKLGGKMVPFGGFYMPVRYFSDIEEHNTVRNGVGVFDVSHMGEFLVNGPKALDLIQKITTNDASSLQIGQAQYSCFPNDTGGIIDDLIVYKIGEENYMLVVNASNINKDWKWINQHNHEGAELKNISDNISLFAIQGPKSTAAIQALTDVNLDNIKNYHFIIGEFAGVKDVIISATGYTGAGGFEIYVNKEHSQHIWDSIFEAGKEEDIKPIGLGARDTLRLEMGYCLYGNDINDETSPIEAGLGWITKFTKEFINSNHLKFQKKNGVDKKLIGFILREKGIPRAQYPIVNINREVIGKVTSGTLSPTMGIGIGLGYVSSAYSLPGTSISIIIRNKYVGAIVEKLPLLRK